MRNEDMIYRAAARVWLVVCVFLGCAAFVLFARLVAPLPLCGVVTLAVAFLFVGGRAASAALRESRIQLSDVEREGSAAVEWLQQHLFDLKTVWKQVDLNPISEHEEVEGHVTPNYFVLTYYPRRSSYTGDGVRGAWIEFLESDIRSISFSRRKAAGLFPGSYCRLYIHFNRGGYLFVDYTPAFSGATPFSLWRHQEDLFVSFGLTLRKIPSDAAQL